MAADFHVHIINNDRERYHCANFIRASMSSSMIPVGFDKDKWSRCYDEFLVNGNWMPDDYVYSELSNEDFDNLDFTNGVRKIHVYCDDHIVFNTDNIFICDTVKTDKMPDVPDALIHGTELKRLNHDTIEEITKLADHPSKVKEFLAKNIGKEYFVTAW